MSRAIQIRVAESVTRTVHVEDGVESPLELLPILPPARMGELLAAELVALGFERDGDRATRVEPDGMIITVDLEAATISIKLGAGTEVAETVERSATVGEERQATARAVLSQEAMEELEGRIAERTEALRRGVTAQLETKLGDLRAELDGAIGRATIAALTERAGQLGQIESVVGDAAGNVTIRVKV